MHHASLGEKGQVTLPKAIRDNYQLTKGGEVRMIDLGNGTVEVILLKHSSQLPPPVVKVRKKVSLKQMKVEIRRVSSVRHK